MIYDIIKNYRFLMIFYILSYIFMYYSYISNNPLTSCLFLIIGILFVVPVVSGYIPVWILYLFVILFLTGILIIVLYFTSLRVITHFYLSSLKYILLIGFFFYPSFYFLFGGLWFGVIFISEFFLLILLLLFVLISLMIFRSYILRCRNALRNI